MADNEGHKETPEFGAEPDMVKKEIPADFQKKFGQASDALSGGDIDHAKEIFLKLTLDYPDIDKGWFGLAEVSFIQDNYSGCAQAYKKCLDITPSFGVYNKLQGLAQGKALRLFELSKALYDAGLYDESLKFTDHLVEMDLSPEIRLKTRVLREELHEIISKGWRESSESFKKDERNVSIFSTVATVMVALLIVAGVVFLYFKAFKADPLKKGIEEYEAAVRDKSNFETTEKGGMIVKKRFEKVAVLFKDSIAKNPSNADAYFWLAKTYQQQEVVNRHLTHMGEASGLPLDFSKEIEENLKKAVELNDNFADAYLQLVVLNFQKKNYQAAREYIVKARESAQKMYGGDTPADKSNLDRVLQSSNTMMSIIKTRMENDKKMPKPDQEKDNPASKREEKTRELPNVPENPAGAEAMPVKKASPKAVKEPVGAKVKPVKISPKKVVSPDNKAKENK